MDVEGNQPPHKNMILQKWHLMLRLLQESKTGPSWNHHKTWQRQSTAVPVDRHITPWCCYAAMFTSLRYTFPQTLLKIKLIFLPPKPLPQGMVIMADTSTSRRTSTHNRAFTYSSSFTYKLTCMRGDPKAFVGDWQIMQLPTLFLVLQI